MHTAPGKRVAAGGPTTDGTQKNGTSSHQTRVVNRLRVCSHLIAFETYGCLRRSMTNRECKYIELHAASAFSFLAGSSQPDAFIERAVELEMPALAIADRNGLYGVARLHTAALRNKVRAHIGAEIS